MNKIDPQVLTIAPTVNGIWIQYSASVDTRVHVGRARLPRLGPFRRVFAQIRAPIPAG